MGGASDPRQADGLASDDPPRRGNDLVNKTGRPLTQADREEIFRIATTSFVRRYGDRFAVGMTDNELAAALETALGIFGGSAGPGRLSVAFTGSGLRIWGGWHIVNHVTEKPLFAGSATIAMARTTYAIADPDNKQLDLF